MHQLRTLESDGLNERDEKQFYPKSKEYRPSINMLNFCVAQATKIFFVMHLISPR